jgi:hypothetical protein
VTTESLEGQVRIILYRWRKDDPTAWDLIETAAKIVALCVDDTAETIAQKLDPSDVRDRECLT